MQAERRWSERHASPSREGNGIGVASHESCASLIRREVG